ncbi:MAG: UPF0175 family protein [Candidatus Korarchaeota archaeon]|nr:UPF0175 family protein [Candidatus Korarchaeota archaeon]
MGRPVTNLSKILKSLTGPEPQDWILAILYLSPGRRVRSRIHLQKALFIASQYMKRVSESFEFVPYKYGPWSDQVVDVLEMLSNAGKVELEEDRGVRLMDIEAGEKAVQLLSREEVQMAKEIMSLVNELDEEELLLYIYVNFGFAGKSEAANILEKERRFKIAVRMLRKGVVSTGMAAKLAGMPYEEFLKKIKEEGLAKLA